MHLVVLDDVCLLHEFYGEMVREDTGFWEGGRGAVRESHVNRPLRTVASHRDNRSCGTYIYLGDNQRNLDDRLWLTRGR
jgi:hypothetical protein